MNSSILDYWRQIEMLAMPATPRAGEGSASVIEMTEKPLPWTQSIFMPSRNQTWQHIVHLGVIHQAAVVDYLASKFGQDLDNSGERPVSANTSMAVLVLNEKGMPMDGGYGVSSFLYALACIHHQKKTDHFEAWHRDFTAGFASRHQNSTSLNKGSLERELQALIKAAEAEEVISQIIGQGKPRILIESRQVSTKRKEPVESVINSFYLRDLNRLLDIATTGGNIGKPLSHFMSSNPHAQRVDIQHGIAHDPGSILPLISPSKLPRGRWPSSPEEPLVLAQQIAANRLLGERVNQWVEGVNGPPGTGKTTLLRELIADIVVERATRIANLPSPKGLFASEGERMGPSTHTAILPSIMNGTSIVVTSNNNAAVLNISTEIPALKQIAPEFRDAANYFKDEASALYGIESWGLMAAPLGNSDLRSRFLRLWFGSDCNLKSALSAAAAKPYHERLKVWEIAREQFKTRLAAVTKIQGELQTIHDELAALPKIRAEREENQRELSYLDNQVALHEQQGHQLERLLGQSKKAVGDARDDLRLHALERPAWWKRIFLGWTQSVRVWAEKNNHLTRAIIHAEREQRAREETLGEHKNKAIKAADTKARLVSKDKALTRRIDDIETMLREARDNGLQVPDDGFWSLPLPERHVASPWHSQTMAKLRSLLFLDAMDLHKASILAEAKTFQANLGLAIDLISQPQKLDINAKQKRAIWQSLFFLTPVVSTSLASFPRLFESFGEGGLDWVLIDEAGQATPQSVAGPIWRAKRTVMVGDPLQVEPVVTLPSSIFRMLGDQLQVPDIWHPNWTSAQSLADRITPYGAYLGDGKSATWAGLPLRVHRRCQNPMFDIANNIAYDGQMVHAVRPANQMTPLGVSAWYDVPHGQVEQQHAITEELNTMMQIVGKLLPESTTDIFVISPFKSVAHRAERRLRSAGVLREHRGDDGAQELKAETNQPRVQVGTIHALQGKETDAVILVLGGNPSSPGAKSWASSKPNMLNVAITRAKQHLYVVGNHSTWSRYPYFGELARSLPKRELGQLAFFGMRDSVMA
ncbi:MAG: DEAD/DEAH box helicase [Chloroflexota bacterium]